MQDKATCQPQDQSCQAEKLRRNSSVFNCRLNVDSDGDDVTWTSRVFHIGADAPQPLEKTGRRWRDGEKLERQVQLSMLIATAVEMECLPHDRDRQRGTEAPFHVYSGILERRA